MTPEASELFVTCLVSKAGLSAGAFGLYWPPPVDNYSKKDTGFDREGG